MRPTLHAPGSDITALYNWVRVKALSQTSCLATGYTVIVLCGITSLFDSRVCLRLFTTQLPDSQQWVHLSMWEHLQKVAYYNPLQTRTLLGKFKWSCDGLDRCPGELPVHTFLPSSPVFSTIWTVSGKYQALYGLCLASMQTVQGHKGQFNTVHAFLEVHPHLVSHTLGVICHWVWLVPLRPVPSIPPVGVSRCE